MIEIIPNWHPFFVHFSITLLSVSVVVYMFSVFAKQYSVRYQLRLIARWSLWTGTVISVLTVAAGIYAYYTVNHDGPSHEWMTIHRNVALATFAIFVIASIWSAVCARTKTDEQKSFAVLILVGFLSLVSTGWLGSELVYRYGLGVMSLPQSTGAGHDHDHGDGQSHHSNDMSSGHDDLMGGADLMQEGSSHQHSHSDNKPHAH